MAIVEMVKETNFKDKIASGTVLVDFYADWCGPCKMLAPVLERLAAQHEKTVFLKLDIDGAGQLATEFRVMSIPTLVLFKDGKEAGRLIGVHSEEKMRDLIES